MDLSRTWQLHMEANEATKNKREQWDYNCSHTIISQVERFPASHENFQWSAFSWPSSEFCCCWRNCEQPLMVVAHHWWDSNYGSLHFQQPLVKNVVTKAFLEEHESALPQASLNQCWIFLTSKRQACYNAILTPRFLLLLLLCNRKNGLTHYPTANTLSNG